MARLPKEHRFDSREARSRLKPRAEPYWRQIVPGTFIGLRRGKRKSAWVARQRQRNGGYAEQRIGTPDDFANADGEVVLTYAQAVHAATTKQVASRKAAAPRHYQDGLTLNEAFEAYIASRRTTPSERNGRVMSEKNARETEQTWDLRVRNQIGVNLVSSMTRGNIRAWHAETARTPKTIRGKVQPLDLTDPKQVRERRETANRILSIVKAALNHAISAGTLPENTPKYWELVKPFAPGRRPPPRMLTDAEVTSLVQAASDDPPLLDLVTAALATGARYGDLCVLRAQDFDPEAGTIGIAQNKTGDPLRQPLTPEGVKFFRRRCASLAPSDHILLQQNGRPWARSAQSRPMKGLAEKAGIDNFSTKVLRATYGKLLLLATRDLPLVSRALGHSDLRITAEHYAHLLPDEVARGIQKMPPLIAENDPDPKETDSSL